MESEILISFFDSFKTEFEFNGQDNLVFIQEIRVNDEVIDLNKFLQNVTSVKIEGSNNKIKTARRMSYDLPDDEYFFLKVMDLSRANVSIANFDG